MDQTPAASWQSEDVTLGIDRQRQALEPWRCCFWCGSKTTLNAADSKTLGMLPQLLKLVQAADFLRCHRLDLASSWANLWAIDCQPLG